MKKLVIIATIAFFTVVLIGYISLANPRHVVVYGKKARGGYEARQRDLSVIVFSQYELKVFNAYGFRFIGVNKAEFDSLKPPFIRKLNFPIFHYTR